MDATKCTYSLQLIIDFAIKHNIKYEMCSPQTGVLVETGMIIEIDNNFSLSIQTHPVLTLDQFAETSLLFKHKQVYTQKWLYFKSRKHKDPEKLFQHILDLKNTLQTYEEIENGFKLQDGQEIHFLKYDIN